MSRIRLVRDWALRVIERGPQAARGSALRFLEEVEAASRRDWDEGDLLDELAEDALDLCLENLIQAPPGLHGRLLRRDEYRNRLGYMRRI